MKPLKTRWMITMIARVNIAYARPLPLTGPPGMPSRTASLAATGSSEMPMIEITEPVTTGGKYRINRPKNGAMKKVNRPATITAP